MTHCSHCGWYGNWCLRGKECSGWCSPRNGISSLPINQASNRHGRRGLWHCPVWGLGYHYCLQSPSRHYRERFRARAVLSCIHQVCAMWAMWALVYYVVYVGLQSVCLRVSFCVVWLLWIINGVLCYESCSAWLTELINVVCESMSCANSCHAIIRCKAVCPPQDSLLDGKKKAFVCRQSREYS